MRVFILTILIFTCRISLAQIALRELPQKQEISKPAVFDSTCFWYHPFTNNYEIKRYIGQDIYILPYSKLYKNDASVVDSQIRGYYNFFTSSDNELKMNPDLFANKYLTILDAFGNENDWKLKLLFNSRDTIYYIPDYTILENTNGKGTNFIPFVLPAFIEKSKKQYVKKMFVALGDSNPYVVFGDGKAIDAITGVKIDMVYGERWTCIDVALVDLGEDARIYDFYNPVLVFRNSKGNEIFINYTKYIDEETEGKEFKRFYYSNRCRTIDEFKTLEDFKSAELQKKANRNN